ncbi:hypothetical protein N752_30595 [Desulforamulus aquiferis]|nr:hypothetical protein N752_30595 [Desulforamulus aquiferis]
MLVPSRSAYKYSFSVLLRQVPDVLSISLGLSRAAEDANFFADDLGGSFPGWAKDFAGIDFLGIFFYDLSAGVNKGLPDVGVNVYLANAQGNCLLYRFIGNTRGAV